MENWNQRKVRLLAHLFVCSRVRDLMAAMGPLVSACILASPQNTTKVFHRFADVVHFLGSSTEYI